MGLRNSAFRKFLPKSFSYGSNEYKQKLIERDLEADLMMIEAFIFPYEEIEDEDLEIRSSIDYNIYLKIEKLLSENNIVEHCNNICSILKAGYVQIILDELNSDNLKQFDKELLNLFYLFKKHKPNQIAFKTETKEGTVTIEDEYFIDVICKIIKDNLYDDPYYLASINKAKGGKPISKITYSKKNTLFNMIFYLFHHTNLIKCSSTELFQTPSIDNKLCNLILEMLLISQNEEVENLGKYGDAQEKHMRMKIVRLLKDNSNLEAYFKGDYSNQFFIVDDAFIDRINDMHF